MNRDYFKASATDSFVEENVALFELFDGTNGKECCEAMGRRGEWFSHATAITFALRGCAKGSYDTYRSQEGQI
jgi:hypothetical protein